jgi:hypothetical protein
MNFLEQLVSGLWSPQLLLHYSVKLFLSADDCTEQWIRCTKNWMKSLSNYQPDSQS